MSDIQTRIAKLVANQLAVPLVDVTPDRNFRENLGADSLDLVEIVMQIEDEFALEITDDDAEKIKTVQHAIDYVTKHIAP